tara:strand:+ start:207 stop:557 length:351 start_codon:yes stop_codon:yes gene_type:complete
MKNLRKKLVDPIEDDKPTLLDTIKSHLKSIPVTERLHPDFKIVLSYDAWEKITEDSGYKITPNDDPCAENIIMILGYKFKADPIQTKHFDFYNPVKAGSVSVSGIGIQEDISCLLE